VHRGGSGQVEAHRQQGHEAGADLDDGGLLERLLSEPALMPGMSILRAGTLDDPSWLKPTMEIFCDSAQPWVELGGGMQRFPKMPGPG